MTSLGQYMAIFTFWILHHSQMFVKAYPPLQTIFHMMESQFVVQILHICDKYKKHVRLR